MLLFNRRVFVWLRTNKYRDGLKINGERIIKCMFMAFVDLEKAFDRVPLEVV